MWEIIGDGDDRRIVPMAERFWSVASTLRLSPLWAGPRVCIGNHVAILESHLIRAKLVQRERAALVPGQTISLSRLRSAVGTVDHGRIAVGLPFLADIGGSLLHGRKAQPTAITLEVSDAFMRRDLFGLFVRAPTPMQHESFGRSINVAPEGCCAPHTFAPTS